MVKCLSCLREIIGEVEEGKPQLCKECGIRIFGLKNRRKIK